LDVLCSATTDWLCPSLPALASLLRSLSAMKLIEDLNERNDTQTKTTELYARFREVSINIRLRARHRGPRRQRHTWALAVYERIEHLFGSALYLEMDGGGWIYHRDQPDADNQIQSMERGLSRRQAQRTDTPAQRLGFEIRSRRLELGWNQERLSTEAGLNRTHLSQIELGKHQVQAETYLKLKNVLNLEPDRGAELCPSVERALKFCPTCKQRTF
jgi:DNA-binding XRE family transcriptional regulator